MVGQRHEARGTTCEGRAASAGPCGTVPTMSSHPGPAVLGRGVVVAAAQPAPDAWSGAPAWWSTTQPSSTPARSSRALHTAWLDRTPVVVELQVDPQRFRRPESVVVEPCELGPDHELWLDRLHFLVWANTYDARAGEPIWWWARKAARLGATLARGGRADRRPHPRRAPRRRHAGLDRRRPAAGRGRPTGSTAR